MVGFGPAGAVVALCLTKQGHEVTVFERDADPFSLDFQAIKDRSYPLIVGTKGSAVMQECGILSYF